LNSFFHVEDGIEVILISAGNLDIGAAVAHVLFVIVEVGPLVVLVRGFLHCVRVR
jgi:hypothetical protein